MPTLREWLFKHEDYYITDQDSPRWMWWWNLTRVRVRVTAEAWRRFHDLPRRFGPAYREWDRDAVVYYLKPLHLLARLCHRLGGRYMLHALLLKLGFLARNEKLSGVEQSYYSNMKWQWRFWKGPYHDAAIERGLPVPKWRDSWRRW